jgi:hypothetical protein
MVKDQTRNLEILGCAIAHHSSMLSHRPGMTRTHPLSRSETGNPRKFFIIFIDWIFTSFVERSFTSAFDVIGPLHALSCVSHARNAD